VNLATSGAAKPVAAALLRRVRRVKRRALVVSFFISANTPLEGILKR
jgi:hypothetical protein